MQLREVRILILILTLLSLSSPLRAELTYLDSGQWSFNQDCAAWNDTLATTLAYGLQLWDCADAGVPLPLDDFYTEGHKAWAVARDGDLLALSTWNGPLYLLTIGDDASLELQARLPGLPDKSDLLLHHAGATRLCFSVGEGDPSLRIHDFDLPSLPEARGSLHLGGTPNGLALRDETLFVSARDFGLHAVDVTDPDAPLLLGSLILPGGQQSLSVDGELAVLASGMDGFTVVDIADPAAMTLVTMVSPSAGQHTDLKVREVILTGTTLHAICEIAGALVYDLSDPAAPLLVGYDPRLDQTPTVEPYYIFNRGVRDAGRLYLSQWSGKQPGAVILDAGSPTVDYLGQTAAYDYVRDLDTAGEFVFTCTGQSGLLLHEHGAEGSLIQRGELVIPKAWGVQARGDFVYVASTREGLVIGDVSDPDLPIIRATAAVGQARNLALVGDLAYVAAFNSGLCTVDVSDPDAPLILGYASRLGMESVNVAVVGTLAVTADMDDGMNLWDLSDPVNILHLANLPTVGRAVDIVLDPDGHYAYLAVNESQALVVDISTPSAPIALGSFVSGANNLDLEAGTLYASTGGGGVIAFDQAGFPDDPQVLCSFDTAHTAMAVAGHAVAGADPRLYVADYSALLALELDTGTPTSLLNFHLFAEDGGVGVSMEFAEAMTGDNLRLLVDNHGEEYAVELSGFAGGLHWRGHDSTVNDGPRTYRLHARDGEGEDWQLLRAASYDPGPSSVLLMLETWPNPGHGSSELRFTLDDEAELELALYDLAGRRLRVLATGDFAAGERHLVWDGRDEQGSFLPAGVYFLRLAGRAADGATFSASRKLVRLP
jgi:hypothetical protein